MAVTPGGTYYAADTETLTGYPAISLALANQLESRFAAKAPTASPTFTGTVTIPDVTLTGWTSYTPALTASVTNPTLGTGSSTTGFYTRVGKLVIGKVQFIFGSSPNAGSGVYRISRPVNGTTNVYHSNSAWLYDSSAGQSHMAMLVGSFSATYWEIYYTATGTYYTQNGSPWTWAQGDVISAVFVYEAA